MQKNKKKLLIGCLFAILSAILFSSKVILVKIIYQFQTPSISAFKVLTLRYLVAAPVIVLIQILFHSKLKKHPPINVKIKRKHFFLFIIVGLLGYTVSSWFDFKGLSFTSASIERIILFSYPTITILLSAIIFKTKIKKSQMIALMITFMGILIAFYDELKYDKNDSYFIVGVILICLSSFFYALYLIFSPPFIHHFGALIHANYTILLNSIFLFILFCLLNSEKLFTFSPQLWIYFIALGIFATIIPIYLVNLSIQIIGANNTAILSTIGPISTIFQAYWFLGEPIHLMQIIGTIFVTIGVVLITLNVKKNVDEKTPTL